MYAGIMIIPKQNKLERKIRRNFTRENVKTNASKPLYEGKLSTKNAKYKDLLHLKQFVIKEESHIQIMKSINRFSYFKFVPSRDGRVGGGGLF